MAYKLFTKEFIHDLQKKACDLDILSYIMLSKKKTFHDAVIELSDFFCVKPEYTQGNCSLKHQRSENPAINELLDKLFEALDKETQGM